MALGAFLGGIFIDLDHVLEGYLEYGMKFNPLHTVDVCQRAALKKIYVFLHSYELILVYALAVFLLQKWGVWFGIGVGMTLHLVLDSTNNCWHPNGYFLIKRFRVGFDLNKILNKPTYFKKYSSDK